METDAVEELEYTGEKVKKKIEIKKFKQSSRKTGTIDKNKFSIFGEVLDKKKKQGDGPLDDGDPEVDLQHFKLKRSIDQNITEKDSDKSDVKKNLNKPVKLKHIDDNDTRNVASDNQKNDLMEPKSIGSPRLLRQTRAIVKDDDKQEENEIDWSRFENKQRISNDSPIHLEATVNTETTSVENGTDKNHSGKSQDLSSNPVENSYSYRRKSADLKEDSKMNWKDFESQDVTETGNIKKRKINADGEEDEVFNWSTFETNTEDIQETNTYISEEIERVESITEESNQNRESDQQVEDNVDTDIVLDHQNLEANELQEVTENDIEEVEKEGEEHIVENEKSKNHGIKTEKVEVKKARMNSAKLLKPIHTISGDQSDLESSAVEPRISPNEDHRNSWVNLSSKELERKVSVVPVPKEPELLNHAEIRMQNIGAEISDSVVLETQVRDIIFQAEVESNSDSSGLKTPTKHRNSSSTKSKKSKGRIIKSKSRSSSSFSSLENESEFSYIQKHQAVTTSFDSKTNYRTSRRKVKSGDYSNFDYKSYSTTSDGKVKTKHVAQDDMQIGTMDIDTQYRSKNTKQKDYEVGGYKRKAYELADYKRNDYELDDYKRKDYEVGDYKRKDYELGDYKQKDYELGGYKRRDFELDDYKRKDYEVGSYKRKDYKMDDYKRIDYELGDCKRTDHELDDYKRKDFELSDYKRKDYELSDYKREDYEVGGYKRKDYELDDYKRKDYELGDYKRKDYELDDYKRKDYEVGGYKRKDYELDDYKRKDYEKDNYKRKDYELEAYEKKYYKTKNLNMGDYKITAIARYVRDLKDIEGGPEHPEEVNSANSAEEVKRRREKPDSSMEKLDRRIHPTVEVINIDSFEHNSKYNDELGRNNYELKVDEVNITNNKGVNTDEFISKSKRFNLDLLGISTNKSDASVSDKESNYSRQFSNESADKNKKVKSVKRHMLDNDDAALDNMLRHGTNYGIHKNENSDATSREIIEDIKINGDWILLAAGNQTILNQDSPQNNEVLLVKIGKVVNQSSYIPDTWVLIARGVEVGVTISEEWTSLAQGSDVLECGNESLKKYRRWSMDLDAVKTLDISQSFNSTNDRKQWDLSYMPIPKQDILLTANVSMLDDKIMNFEMIRRTTYKQNPSEKHIVHKCYCIQSSSRNGQLKQTRIKELLFS